MFGISLLNTERRFVEVCAAWDFAEWGCQMPHVSLSKALENFRRSAEDEQLPLVWVATQGGRPIGMVSLTDEDHPDYKHLAPWLSALYVHPKFRLQGVAKALCRHVVKEAIGRGHSSVYLYTATAEPLYRDIGWEPIGVVTGPTGLSETLMVLSCG
jgi:predicted N-acetyltransferase YhbS